MQETFLPRFKEFDATYVGTPIFDSEFVTTYGQVWESKNIGFIYTNCDPNTEWPAVAIDFVQNEKTDVSWSSSEIILAENKFDAFENSSRDCFDFLKDQLNKCDKSFLNDTAKLVTDCLYRQLLCSPDSGKFRCLFLSKNLFIGYAIEYYQIITPKLTIKKKAKIYCVYKFIQP